MVSLASALVIPGTCEREVTPQGMSSVKLFSLVLVTLGTYDRRATPQVDIPQTQVWGWNTETGGICYTAISTVLMEHPVILINIHG